MNDDIGEFKVEWHDLYSIDTKTGAVAFPEGTTYEAEDGQWTGSASVTVCVSLSSFYSKSLRCMTELTCMVKQPTCSGNKIVKDSKKYSLISLLPSF